MQILEQDDQRPVACRHLEQPPKRPEGVARLGERSLAQRSEDAGGIGLIRKEIVERLELLEDVADRQQACAVAVRPAPPRQRPRPALRLREERVREPRLADPRLADQDDATRGLATRSTSASAPSSASSSATRPTIGMSRWRANDSAPGSNRSTRYPTPDSCGTTSTAAGTTRNASDPSSRSPAAACASRHPDAFDLSLRILLTGKPLDSRPHDEPLRQRGARFTHGAKRPQRVVVVRDRRAEDGDELLGQQLSNLSFVAVDDDRDLREDGGRLLADTLVLQVDELEQRDDRVAPEAVRRVVGRRRQI